jgi:hypothetical protein
MAAELHKYWVSSPRMSKLVVAVLIVAALLFLAVVISAAAWGRTQEDPANRRLPSSQCELPLAERKGAWMCPTGSTP